MVQLRRARFAAHRDILAIVPLCEIGHRRPGFHAQGRGNRIFSRLDAGQDQRRPAPRLVGGDDPMAANRNPLQPTRTPALDDINPGARGIHPDPEAGQFVIPEHRVLGHRKRLDRAPRDRLVLQFRHPAARSYRLSLCAMMSASMLPPTLAAETFSVSRARWA